MFGSNIEYRIKPIELLIEDWANKEAIEFPKHITQYLKALGDNRIKSF